MFSSVRALQQRPQLGLRNLSADQDTFARWPGLARLFDGMGRILTSLSPALRNVSAPRRHTPRPARKQDKPANEEREDELNGRFTVGHSFTIPMFAIRTSNDSFISPLMPGAGSTEHRL
jgi:hypothetical protein